MDYQIINRADIPPRRWSRPCVWLSIIQLQENEAMKLEVENSSEAHRLQRCAIASLRRERQRRLNLNFSIKTRTFKLENGKAILYVWKEIKATDE